MRRDAGCRSTVPSVLPRRFPYDLAGDDIVGVAILAVLPRRLPKELTDVAGEFADILNTSVFGPVRFDKETQSEAVAEQRDRFTSQRKSPVGKL